MGILEDKVVLISGGARGMGSEHVRRIVSEGGKVVFTDLLDEDGPALAAELGASAEFVRADVSSEEDWVKVVALAESRFGKLDGLVNNAGIVIRAPFENFSVDDYRKVVEVNQVGTFLGMKAVIPAMRRAGGGSIVNISSIAGLVGRVQTVAYSSSKFAVRGLTKVGATELGEYGIRVNSIHPGAVMTPMLQGMDKSVVDSLTGAVPLNRICQPEEVSSLIAFLLSNLSSYCSGAEITIDGGMTAH
ncbi:glucose 1-dehydrogenase [Sphingobium sp. JS3065]|uniref:glucose 1-dehydrogenase n=1 Tax=Sphingobium sp. JS3065 TaxID=2970925 RepID=UPI002263C151|nr:glucose 1-dehydrogenase [Sphingobium sp. JS3065]UZW57505.1 glucose 1-dehydrogenase [Sphingobium sp. JS3065]